MVLQQNFPLAQQEANVVREAVPLRPWRVTPLRLPDCESCAQCLAWSPCALATKVRVGKLLEQSWLKAC